jgi:hypothetical protein
MPECQTATTAPTVLIIHHHKRGRPRKLNVKRDRSGKSRGEDRSLEVIFTQPHRQGFADPNSELLGYPLGRLRAMDQISEDQHRAGNEWAMLVWSYAGIMGIPVGSVKSGSAHPEIASGSVTSAGPLPGTEEHEKRIQRVRSRYDGCFERLAELGRSVGSGRDILIAARRVCIEERYPTPEEMGDLRLALNALAHELKIGS